MANSRGNKASEATRNRLLLSAKRCFAYAGLSVRVADIVQAADANIAAINYHFGSKEKLLEEVLVASCVAVSDERTEMLSKVTASGRVASVAEIIEAWIVPALRQAFRSEIEGPFLAQLTQLVLSSDQSNKIGMAVRLQLERCNALFLDALACSRPDLQRASLEWRLFAMIGVLVFVAGRNTTDKVPSDDVALGSTTFEAAKMEILPFLIAGFEAPAPLDHPHSSVPGTPVHSTN